MISYGSHQVLISFGCTRDMHLPDPVIGDQLMVSTDQCSCHANLEGEFNKLHVFVSLGVKMSNAKLRFGEEILQYF
jgi:hypothetical protein